MRWQATKKRQRQTNAKAAGEEADTKVRRRENKKRSNARET